MSAERGDMDKQTVEVIKKTVELIHTLKGLVDLQGMEIERLEKRVTSLEGK